MERQKRLWMNRPDMRRVQDISPTELVESIRRVSQRWQSKTGARFLGIGRRKQAGKLGDEWCVKFYVTRKTRRPREERRVPRNITLTVRTRGRLHRIRLASDVVAIAGLRPILAQSGPISYIYNEEAPDAKGSVAGVLQEGESGPRFLLTAGHVAARTLTATAASPGEPVLDEDGNVIGTLSFAPDIAKTSVDAALISPSSSVSYPDLLRRTDGQAVNEVCPLQEASASASADYKMLSWIKERLMWFHGYSVDVQQAYKVGMVTFPLLLHFDCSATGGDSGALVVDAQNRAVGMHILGIEGSDSFCLPIETVLEQCARNTSLRIIN